MAKHLLIAPADGEIGSHLETACGNEGYAITTARARGGKTTPDSATSDESHQRYSDRGDESGQRIGVRWEARSFISARNLILAGTNRFERLDVALLIQEPDNTVLVRPDQSTYDRGSSNDTVGESSRLTLLGALHTNSPTTIERHLDLKVTGMMLLAREALSVMVRQRSGTLLMVLSAPLDIPSTSVEASAQAAFIACAESLSVEYQNEPVDIVLFESQKSDAPGFASYIVSNLDSLSDGRRYRYGSRSPGRLRLGGK